MKPVLIKFPVKEISALIATLFAADLWIYENIKKPDFSSYEKKLIYRCRDRIRQGFHLLLTKHDLMDYYEFHNPDYLSRMKKVKYMTIEIRSKKELEVILISLAACELEFADNIVDFTIPIPNLLNWYEDFSIKQLSTIRKRIERAVQKAGLEIPFPSSKHALS
ncbi:hypothetical protein KKF34_06215 [Myxococcota bacterium]|nr:hypothetical protein [Myxococcota bacterium]MBU1379190.1 hypothetical protein [Myxococcota bacterium]MBU1496453.1 hypothetical protein [Myxococcota bacterium]